MFPRALPSGSRKPLKRLDLNFYIAFEDLLKIKIRDIRRD